MHAPFPPSLMFVLLSARWRRAGRKRSVLLVPRTSETNALPGPARAVSTRRGVGLVTARKASHRPAAVCHRHRRRSLSRRLPARERCDGKWQQNRSE